MAAGLGEIEAILKALLAETRSEIVNLGVSDAQGRELTLEHWPAVGSKRVLANRTGNGTDGLAVPTTGVLFLTPNEARLGLEVVNSGTNPIIVYLSDQQRKGVPCVWLAASGGAWDGMFGNLPWCGNVFLVAQTAASSIVGGEL
jgi:hypothetical protein